MRIYQEHAVGARRGLGCIGCLTPLFSLAMTCGISSVTMYTISLSRQGSDEAAIAAFSACPAVTSALGTPLRKHPLSFGCGEYEGGAGSGDASWQLTVKGPRGTAAGWYTASYRDGEPWTVTGGVLTLDSGSVVSLPCVPERAPPEPTPGGDRRKGPRGDGPGKRKAH